jgi:hypothetical protein
VTMGKVVKIIPYRPIWPVFVVPVGDPVRKLPLKCIG